MRWCLFLIGKSISIGILQRLSLIYVSVTYTQHTQLTRISPSRPFWHIRMFIVNFNNRLAKAVFRINFIRYFSTLLFFFFVRGGRSGGNFIRIKWLWSFYFDFKLCFIAVFIIYYIFFSSLCSIFLSLAHALVSLSSPLRVFATRDKLYICFYMLLLLLSLSWSVVVVVVMMVVQLQLAKELIFLLLLLFVVCIGYLVYSAVMIRSG